MISMIFQLLLPAHSLVGHAVTHRGVYATQRNAPLGIVVGYTNVVYCLAVGILLVNFSIFITLANRMFLEDFKSFYFLPFTHACFLGIQAIKINFHWNILITMRHILLLFDNAQVFKQLWQHFSLLRIIFLLLPYNWSFPINSHWLRKSPVYRTLRYSKGFLRNYLDYLIILSF